MATDQTLIPSAEVARRLNLSQATVTRMARDGRLVAAAKLPGLRGGYLFDPAVIDEGATK